jgi:hypothetical protein
MIGLLAAATLAAAQPAAAPALPQDLPNKVIFARTTRDGWRLEAMTDVDNVGGFPVIVSAYCELTRSGLKLTTWGETGLWVRFGDNSVEPELDFEAQQIRRIAIDDAVWEYRDIDTRWGEDQFANIAYRSFPPCYGCISARSFTVGMRRRAGHPWLSPALLANALLGARVLRIGFEREEEPHRLVSPMLWAEIPLAGLDGAIAWCRAALASEGARRFHGGLDEE